VRRRSCAEAVWWKCHRSLIADYLKAQGAEVIHILNANEAEPHPFTSREIVDGKLDYYGTERGHGFRIVERLPRRRSKMPSHRDTARAHFFGLDAAGKKAVQSA
jgi:hypothetical protein